jgi:hypothetical protein
LPDTPLPCTLVATKRVYVSGGMHRRLVCFLGVILIGWQTLLPHHGMPFWSAPASM